VANEDETFEGSVTDLSSGDEFEERDRKNK